MAKENLFLTSAAIVVALVIGSNIFGCMESYSEGDRSGVVTKVSKKGIFVKTWECEMNLGGMVNGGEDSGMVANIWRFTVDDEDVLARIQEAQKARKPVTLEYRQWLVSPRFRTDSGYIIRSIR